MECNMRYFNPQADTEIACSVARLNGPSIDRRQAASTVIVTCLAMLAWCMTSLGVQLATPLGSAMAVALLAAMGNHLYQWTIGRARKGVAQLPNKQHEVLSQTQSAA
jgi:hypothetical protein